MCKMTLFFNVSSVMQSGHLMKAEMSNNPEIETSDASSSCLLFPKSQGPQFTEVVALSNVITLENLAGQAPTDEVTEFRAICANYLENCRKNYSLLRNETEEHAEVRRAQNAQRMRNYRQKQRSQETPEQAAARRAENALRVRNYRKLKYSSPEAAIHYRSHNALRMRIYRERQKAIETDEEAAARKARNAERVKLYRKLKQAVEPDVYRAHNAKRMREYRRSKVETTVSDSSNSLS